MSDQPILSGPASADAHDDPVAVQPTDGERRAVAALDQSGIAYTLTRHGPVRSLAEAARVRATFLTTDR